MSDEERESPSRNRSVATEADVFSSSKSRSHERLRLCREAYNMTDRAARVVCIAFKVLTVTRSDHDYFTLQTLCDISDALHHAVSRLRLQP